MARHAPSKNPAARRALAVLATAGAVLGAGAGQAAADATPLGGLPNTRTGSLGKIDPEAGLRAAVGTVRYGTGPVTGLKPNPLVGTGVDPFDNAVNTQLADFAPMSTKAVTAPLAQAPSVGDIPVVGQAARSLG
ncbi:hypothetical protein ACFV6E_41695 [Streptomyces sp. NPDC059785]|uniref:hypothetical protein n=1 Tax=unclassified Streptomyces TaxID=2593676 RepID=UPI0036575B8A